MPSGKLYNLARMTTATTGTGTIVLAAAAASYLTFAQAGIQDGDIISYSIIDGNNREIGRGVYTASSLTLTRSVLRSTNNNNPISLSGSAQVFITPSAEDLSLDPTVPAGNPGIHNWMVGATGVSGAPQTPTWSPGVVPRTDSNLVFSGQGAIPFSVLSRNPYCLGASPCTITEPVPTTKTFSLRISATGLTTQTVSYTAVSTDSQADIANKLGAAFNANTVLNNVQSGTRMGLPSFCYPDPGNNWFNIQWDVRFADWKVTSVGTGAISIPTIRRTLDNVFYHIGRFVENYQGQAGDSICTMMFSGQVSGATNYLFQYGQIIMMVADAVSPTGEMFIQTAFQWNQQTHLSLKNGWLLYDGSNGPAAGGYQGFGTINLPGGYYVNGSKVATRKEIDDELIAPLVAALRQLRRDNEAMAARIAALEARV
jgi:hypothetical protein